MQKKQFLKFNLRIDVLPDKDLLRLAGKFCEISGQMFGAKEGIFRLIFDKL